MSFVAINPATEEVIAEYPVLSAGEVDQALERASHAFGSWRRATFAERAALMTRAAELLESEVPVIAELMTLEMGKTFAAAKGEAMKCAATMRYFAEHTEAMLRDESLPTKGSRSGVRFDPIGPIFAVMPWNFPWWQVVRMAVPTLMAGNVVVFKHAPNVPGNAKYLEDLFLRAGFAPGVLTSVFVDIDQVPGIIADPRIAAVTLTGSERAGRSVAEHAGKNLKKCVLELGGSDPFIVAPSADLDLTVPGAVAARIQNNGQACIAAKRFIVVRERADEFLERYSVAMGAVRLGDPMDPATELGPLVSKSQRDLLDAQVSSSIDKGAQALVGGVVPEQTGFYYPATVLVQVPVDTRAACEELFGPVSVVLVARDLTDALRVANDTPWGLGASVWAQADDEVNQAIAELEVGTVFANAMVASMNELPFGGTKRSGFGRELSALGAREFMNPKSFFVA
ncbi:MAG TPA: NAD-dependent succinate-semialdehyde dehydrogenase [Acidimicrobiales bacterium]|jgi:succinate-semialdehyde dehydrogenase/glutarate-semialdehyde dehydrogenase|nr:NAD-dependent succinate-semialdehyde dehydrogenase [Acidimicrobiales bacterium]